MLRTRKKTRQLKRKFLNIFLNGYLVQRYLQADKLGDDAKEEDEE